MTGIQFKGSSVPSCSIRATDTMLIGMMPAVSGAGKKEMARECTKDCYIDESVCVVVKGEA